MFGFFKNLLGQPDDQTIADAIRGGAFLVDVRMPAEFASGSVPGAVNIPLDKVEARISEFKNKKGIVVFCRSGNRSAQAKSILERHGITGVVNGGTWDHVASIKKGL
ncbi:MAG: rhodanese-like domain-containing protein [Porphyromonadaceae bacterium]|nr:rhodanese-like domain-containing protein [Porphyromonadaceae bacterium]